MTRNATSWEVSRSTYRNTPRPMPSARTATTATASAVTFGCWAARAMRYPEVASSPIPAAVVAAPARAAWSCRACLGRACACCRRCGQVPGVEGDDAVGVPGPGLVVGDEDDGAAGHESFDRVADRTGGLAVEG